MLIVLAIAFPFSNAVGAQVRGVVAADFLWETFHQGGPEFDGPRGVAVRGTNGAVDYALYAVSAESNIRKYSTAACGRVAKPEFVAPNLCFDKDLGASGSSVQALVIGQGGHLFVTGRSIAQMYDEADKLLLTWAGGTTAGQWAPHGVAATTLDDAGQWGAGARVVYVSDRSTESVLKFAVMNKPGACPQGQQAAGSVAGHENWQACFLAAVGGSAQGTFNDPDGLAVDDAGFLYVADRFHHRIQRFTPDLQFESAWGYNVNGTNQNRYEVCRSDTCVPGQSHADGLMRPNGLSWSSELGLLFVAEAEANRVQAFTRFGRRELVWGWGVLNSSPQLQSCRPGPDGCKRGLAGSGRGQFYAGARNHAFGIAVTRDGVAYVADEVVGAGTRTQAFRLNSGLPTERMGAGGRTIAGPFRATLPGSDGSLLQNMAPSRGVTCVSVANFGPSRLRIAITDAGNAKREFVLETEGSAARCDLVKSISAACEGTCTFDWRADYPDPQLVPMGDPTGLTIRGLYKVEDAPVKDESFDLKWPGQPDTPNGRNVWRAPGGGSFGDDYARCELDETGYVHAIVHDSRQSGEGRAEVRYSSAPASVTATHGPSAVTCAVEAIHRR